jgi:hypothetical protein
MVAKKLGLAAENGACPGEASGSFVDERRPDNGCREKRADRVSRHMSCVSDAER